MYVIFAKSSCPYCQMAEGLLEEKSLPHRIINFSDDQEHILSEIKSSHNWKTVPMIFLEEDGLSSFIGGYTDLCKVLENE